MTETHLSEDLDPIQQHLVKASATAVVDSPERKDNMKAVTGNITRLMLCCQTSENNGIQSYITLIIKGVLIQPIIAIILLCDGISNTVTL